MKFKRLLALALSLTIMTGCSSSNGGSENSDIVTEISEPVEITFWHAMNGQHEATLTALTEEFMEANPNITVTLQNQGSYQDLSAKITATSLSEDDLPTLTQAYPDWMIGFIQDGLMLDLTPYIENSEIGMEDFDDILPSLREAVTFDGQIYGIPFNKSTEVLWYNKTLFEELGLEVPTTYEELAEVSKEIYEAKGIAGAGFDSLSNYYTTFLKSNGETFNSELDVTGQVSQDALAYYQEGIQDGYFRIAGTDRYLSGPFGNEQVAMYMGSNAGESFVEKSVDGKFEVGVAPYPTNASMQQGTDVYVFEKSTPEERTAAFLFLKFLSGTEQQIEWAINTGYFPSRTSAIESDEYKNSASKVASILADATTNLYTNPVTAGTETAYRESGTMLESFLASPKSDINEALENYKTTLASIWQ